MAMVPEGRWAKAGTVATVLGVLVAIYFGVGPSKFPGIFDHHSASGPPVIVDSAMYELNQGASTAAFPRVLNSQQITGINQSSSFKVGNFFQNYMEHVTGAGGAMIGNAPIQIILTGNTDSTSIISGLQVIKRCSTPLTGTLLYSPGAAVDTNVEIGFNLDASFPRAQNYQVGRRFSGDFFTQHTISLKSGETITLLVNNTTASQYCQFTFQLAVDTSGKQVTEVISDHGKPFAVTALANLSKYRALYIGGVATNNGRLTSTSVTALRSAMGL